jgi:hypothetical protein
MTDWYPTIKTIKGRPYLYRQRTWRESGRVRSESQYLGPIEVSTRTAPPELREIRRRKSGATSGIAMAVFGVEDEYGRRIDSVWNRYVNKEQNKASTESEVNKGKPAEAGQEEKSSKRATSDRLGEGQLSTRLRVPLKAPAASL